MSKKKLLDLAPDQLKLVEDILAQHAPGKTVWAYGSRAKWSANQGSDLDLVAFGCTSGEISDLREAFEESDLLASVDVMDWEVIPDKFKENIKKKYVVVQQEEAPSAGWRKVRLGDVVTLQRGFDLLEKNRTRGEYPLMASNGQDGTHNEYKVKAPGVVTGRSGTLGQVYFVNKDFWPLNTTLWVKDFHSNEPIFVYYFLKTLSLDRYNAGSGVPTLNRNHIHPLLVKIPSLPDQKKIAEVLSSLDDKIDLLRRQNKTLAEMAQVLYREWLAKSAKKHWKEGTLSDIAEIEVGERVAKGEPNYLEIGDIDTSTKDYDIAKKEKRTVGNAVKVPKNTLLISTVRPTRGAITITKDEVNVSGAFARIKCEDKLAYAIASRPEFFAYLGGISTGTTYPTCKTADVLDYPIIVPPKKEAAKFNEVISPCFDKVMYNRLQMETLANMRDLLLPKLMNGTVTV